ncbi:hypothetical protein AS850_12590 [Frondihabitans sp. 762G35]|uniref:FMN-binding protein n=1 Tax=Frondihabitans sp. 762G35 TaxID=1446794 RepID=UPI000D20DB50|nr:FMN-binding protein [Frondihabitans sp. 762G35]ARC57914.1 hypothetical protein AS850_12590 [Frondihabitans sp. 762G35]
MRFRIVAGGVVSSAAVLVVGWHLGSEQVLASQVPLTAPLTPATTPATSPATTPSASPSPSASAQATPSATPSAGAAAPAPSATPAPAPTKATVSGTFQGGTAQTQFGPVQVEIVVSNSTITDVKALQLTNMGGRSVQISNYAAPLLRTEALSAQSANIQSISGATYTSMGYQQSLQSAIDAAHL